MKGHRKLGRPTAHRKAMLRNQVTDLLREGRITTTITRAKDVYKRQILGSFTALGIGFGGTSLLIAVGVALDTMKQLESQLIMRNYSGFLK